MYSINIAIYLFVHINFEFLVPDFILKLIIVHDASVMNAFLKTRPVPQEKWEHFLSISQFWKIENLEMPLIILPLCFLFMPFLTGLCVFIAMYLISVFGGFIVMLLKHRGNYQPENAVKAGHQKTFSSAGGKHVFGLQLRSFLRSKRLKTQIIYFGIFFYFYCILYLSRDYEFAVSYMMFFLMFPVMIHLPEEFFGFIAETYGISNDELQSRLKEYESLMSGEILGKRKLIHDFSNGNKQKIGIIGAMIVNPQILILDEPFNYLDPSSQIVVAKLIRKMNEDCGTTALVSSHNLNSISDICNRIILLDKGDIIMDKPHTPGSKDQELESYFLAAVK